MVFASLTLVRLVQYIYYGSDECIQDNDFWTINNRTKDLVPKLIKLTVILSKLEKVDINTHKSLPFFSSKYTTGITGVNRH